MQIHVMIVGISLIRLSIESVSRVGGTTNKFPFSSKPLRSACWSLDSCSSSLKEEPFKSSVVPGVVIQGVSASNRGEVISSMSGSAGFFTSVSVVSTVSTARFFRGLPLPLLGVFIASKSSALASSLFLELDLGTRLCLVVIFKDRREENNEL